jgi:hypothetical protein
MAIKRIYGIYTNIFNINKSTKMSNVVFRGKSEPVTAPVLEKTGDGAHTVTEDTDVPYTDYESTNGRPYTVEYFKLPDTWKEHMGGFVPEVSAIEEYFTSRINSGEIANSHTAVKNELKKIERLTNMTKEERALVKIEAVSAYVEYLMKLERTKYNLRRYSGNRT